MLNDFGRALIQVIHDSSEVNGAARKISREGYSLYLVLDGKEDKARLELTSRTEPAPEPPGRPNAGRPNFRLNSGDVEFLRSVGIDATRSVRRRRHA